MKKKKICVITGSRSDYDLLKPIMNRIKTEENFKLINLITGSHLLKKQGYTYKKMTKDGFRINKKIKILYNSDD